MRIVGGAARGISLRVIRDPQLRPTTDRVRGAIFSMLEARDTVIDSRVLDLYAGTGAMAIEALSRGAAHAVCVERSERLCAVIRENASRAGVADRLETLSLPVERAIPTVQGPFDLVLMDPPYDQSEAILSTIAGLMESPLLLSDEAVLVAEQPSRAVLSLETPRLQEMLTRRYGDTTISMLRRRSESEDDNSAAEMRPMP